jgi:hypothetical protein
MNWTHLDGLIRQDPAGRGLASYRDDAGRALASDLEAAARDLAESATRVLLVTGFAIVTPDGVRAETDGPPGAIFLAGMLRACDVEVDIATDAPAAPLVLAGLRVASQANPQLADVALIELPASFDLAHRDAILAAGYSHLIAIERVGPNHTADSIAAQEVEDAESQVAEFAALVAEEDQDTCRNMRGERIDEQTAPLHLLFEPEEECDGELDEEEPADEEEVEEEIDDAGENLETEDLFDDDEDEEDADVLIPTTIGIADGGNEIGCGNIPWSELRRAVARGPAALTACRIATDHLILSGVSNWGAYALGAAVAALLDQHAALAAWPSDLEAKIIRAMVADAGAVDGTTKRNEPTVDGIALHSYLDTFDEIRRACLDS